MLFSLALLLLLVLPISAEEPEVIFAQVGGSVTLPRKAWSSKTELYVHWYFGTDEQPLILRTPHIPLKKGSQKYWQDRLSFSSDLSLFISPVLDNDFGLFRCQQHEYLTIKETKYQLYRVIVPTMVSLLVGDALSLTCEVEPNPVHPSVKWLRPRGSNYFTKSSKNKHTINVSSISNNHSGDWICTVEHKNQMFNATTSVKIIDLSPSPPDPIYTAVNSSPPSMPCSLSSDISWPVLNGSGLQGGSWSFTPLNSSSLRPLLTLNLSSPAWRDSNGEKGFLQEKVLKERDLAVKSSQVSVKNRGTYTCSLQFKGGRTLSRKVQLEVLEVRSSNSSTSEGSTVNLTCTLGQPLPPGLEVNWIPPKTASRLFLKIHPDSLSLPSVTVQDSGEWKCELRKKKTVLTSAVMALTIEKAPVDAWLFVAVGGAAFIFVLVPVLILIIIHRRRQNVKKRQRKARFCCCKNPQAKGFYKT
ncbi:CD4-1 molecule [Electrophorus electricus]|uniref:Ig-like domain-containing protein n=1 Tax=Electrophorus electricus TaxID=8005 RepID=A0A4W4FNC5_ELEEL|nr:CD4-1 molecule [Electrophorus electricus]